MKILTILLVIFCVNISIFAETKSAAQRIKEINIDENLQLLKRIKEDDYEKKIKIYEKLISLDEENQEYKKQLKAYKKHLKQRKPIMTKGKWQQNISADPITDNKVVYLFLDAHSGRGVYGGIISLIIRCSNNITEMYINWNSFLGDNAKVTSRIGKNKAKTSQWIMSNDTKGTFKPNPIPHIKEMMKSDVYVTRIMPYNENSITAIFDIKGLELAIKELRETCHW